MKIAICSDLHLEFESTPADQLVLENTENADVLVLAGDVLIANDLRPNEPNGLLVGTKSDRYHSFMQDVSSKFKDVIYIAGNHEHYHGDFLKTYDILRDRLAYLKNVHVLDKQAIKIDDITFIAGTLWTDMNRGDPSTIYNASRSMNDYRLVKNFDADLSIIEHQEMIDLIWSAFDDHPNEKFVIVGHHAPSKKSMHPVYTDVHTNGAYSSDLEELIVKNPQIALWIHGHTHARYDYTVGKARIVANPRGYIGHQQLADSFELKFVEV